MFDLVVTQLAPEELTWRGSSPRALQGHPLLWLARRSTSGLGDELLLVNGSEHVLDLVSFSSAAAITVDDAAHGSGSDKRCYRQVQPGQAVKVDEYDNFYDLDYLISIEIEVIAPGLGTLCFKPSPVKGGLKSQLLHVAQICAAD